MNKGLIDLLSAQCYAVRATQKGKWILHYFPIYKCLNKKDEDTFME